ncbi:hypothetical protein JCM6882_005461 [Rhodosporidiobolus microsporus]
MKDPFDNDLERFYIKNPAHPVFVQSLAAHATVFVRTVLPFLYGGGGLQFTEAYQSFLHDWSYDPLVMTVCPVHGQPDHDFVVHLPAFPLVAQIPRSKGHGVARFWQLTPPPYLLACKPPALPVVPGEAVHTYPGPAFLPIDSLPHPHFSRNEIELVQQHEGWIGPLTATEESLKHIPTPTHAYAVPPGFTEWYAELPSDTSNGSEVVRVRVRFDLNLTGPLQRLQREKMEMAAQQERERLEHMQREAARHMRAQLMGWQGGHW